MQHQDDSYKNAFVDTFLMHILIGHRQESRFNFNFYILICCISQDTALVNAEYFNTKQNSGIQSISYYLIRLQVQIKPFYMQLKKYL